jgi:hypothetical protein
VRFCLGNGSTERTGPVTIGFRRFIARGTRGTLDQIHSGPCAL